MVIFIPRATATLPH